MTQLLFVFLSATLISQSFMDAMSVIIIVLMIVKLLTKKTQISALTSGLGLTSIRNLGSDLKSALGAPKVWVKELAFFVLWLILIAVGLRDSPRFIELFSEWKWLLNLYFMYWFLNFFFESRSKPLDRANHFASSQRSFAMGPDLGVLSEIKRRKTKTNT